MSVYTCVFLHVCNVQEVHGRPPTACNAQQMFSTFHVHINPAMWTTKKQPFPIQLSLFQHKSTHFSVLTALIVISARQPFQSNSALSIFHSHPLSSLRACTPLFHFFSSNISLFQLLNCYTVVNITPLDQVKYSLSVWSAVSCRHFFFITSQSGFFTVCSVYIL